MDNGRDFSNNGGKDDQRFHDQFSSSSDQRENWNLHQEEAHTMLSKSLISKKSKTNKNATMVKSKLCHSTQNASVRRKTSGDSTPLSSLELSSESRAINKNASLRPNTSKETTPLSSLELQSELGSADANASLQQNAATETSPLSSSEYENNVIITLGSSTRESDSSFAYKTDSAEDKATFDECRMHNENADIQSNTTISQLCGDHAVTNSDGFISGDDTIRNDNRMRVETEGIFSTTCRDSRNGEGVVDTISTLDSDAPCVENSDPMLNISQSKRKNTFQVELISECNVESSGNENGKVLKGTADTSQCTNTTGIEDSTNKDIIYEEHRHEPKTEIIVKLSDTQDRITTLHSSTTGTENSDIVKEERQTEELQRSFETGNKESLKLKPTHCVYKPEPENDVEVKLNSSSLDSSQIKETQDLVSPDKNRYRRKLQMDNTSKMYSKQKTSETTIEKNDDTCNSSSNITETITRLPDQSPVEQLPSDVRVLEYNHSDEQHHHGNVQMGIPNDSFNPSDEQHHHGNVQMGIPNDSFRRHRQSSIQVRDQSHFDRHGYGNQECSHCHDRIPQCGHCGSARGHIHEVHKTCCQKTVLTCGDCGHQLNAHATGERFEVYRELAGNKELSNGSDRWSARKTPMKRNKNATPQTLTKYSSSTNAPKSEGEVHNQGKAEEKSTAAKVTTNAPYKRSYNGDYYETSNDMSEMVAKEGLIVKDVHPDGNCLFTALVDQLRVRGEFYYTAKTLRQAAVDYLRQHPCQQDGTPLLQFLPDYEGTWEGYLMRMCRDGEWGDHIVISAIASILNRRLVILGGRSTVHRNVVVPTQSHSTRTLLCNDNSASNSTSTQPAQIKPNINPQSNQTARSEESVVDGSRIVQSEEPSDTQQRAEEAEGYGHGEGDEHAFYDDLYLGHIAEAHYVSLRHHDLDSRLYECLKSKKTSCFLQYGTETGNTLKDSNEDTCSQTKIACMSDFPDCHLDFLLKYIRRLDVLPPLEITCPYETVGKGPYSLIVTGDYIMGLETLSFTLTRSFRSRQNRRGYVRQTANTLRDQLNAFGTPCDTEVVFTDYSHTNPKDLIADETDCHIGFTRLRPVTPSRWKQVTSQMHGPTYLKHMFLAQRVNGYIAFRCDWPQVADEWITRERICDWPNGDIRAQIVEDGVRVISQSHIGSSSPEIEWKFSFAIAEKIVCSKAMTKAVRFCFRVLKIILTFVFQELNIITSEHLKSVFFYTCEELPRETFVNEPGKCILFMLQKLEMELTDRCIPDYFIKECNLIEHIEPVSLLWHLERLSVLRTHVIEHLFFLFEFCGITDAFGLKTCFDDLLLDAQKFCIHGRIEDTHSDCFRSLYLLLIRERVKTGDYDMAKKGFETAVQELSKHIFQTPSDKTALMQDVMTGLHVQDQWLFAFYMDSLLGCNLLEYVCRQQDCVTIQTLFGQRFVNALVSDKTSQIQTLDIPTAVTYQMDIVTFVLQFGELLKDFIGNANACIAAIHYFLKKNTHELLVTIATERNECVNYTSHYSTIRKLNTLFVLIYGAYQMGNQTREFSDLLELYDELCNYLDSVECYQWIADQWFAIGDAEKAQLAAMKAASLQHNEYGENGHQSTSI